MRQTRQDSIERLAWMERSEHRLRDAVTLTCSWVVVGERGHDGAVVVRDRVFHEFAVTDGERLEFPDRLAWFEPRQAPRPGGPVCDLYLGSIRDGGQVSATHRFDWYSLPEEDDEQGYPNSFPSRSQTIRNGLMDHGYCGYWRLSSPWEVGQIVTQRGFDGPWFTDHGPLHPDTPSPMKFWKVTAPPPPTCERHLAAGPAFRCMDECFGDRIDSVEAVVATGDGRQVWDDYRFFNIIPHVSHAELWDEGPVEGSAFALEGEVIVSEKARQQLARCGPGVFRFSTAPRTSQRLGA